MTSFDNPQPIPCHSVYIQLQPCSAKDSTKVNICFKHMNTNVDSNKIGFYIQTEIPVGYTIQTNTISRSQDNMFPPPTYWLNKTHIPWYTQSIITYHLSIPMLLSHNNIFSTRNHYTYHSMSRKLTPLSFPGS